jgi:hypothetical protein
VKYLDKKQESLGRFSFDNLLISSDGSLRIIPDSLIPEGELDTLYLYSGIL